MNQSPTLPLPSRKRMSLLPSPLKSPVPAIDQPVGRAPTAAGVTCAPFMDQIPTLLALTNTRSHAPSASTEPRPALDPPGSRLPTPPPLTRAPLTHPLP